MAGWQLRAVVVESAVAKAVAQTSVSWVRTGWGERRYGERRDWQKVEGVGRDEANSTEFFRSVFDLAAAAAATASADLMGVVSGGKENNIILKTPGP